MLQRINFFKNSYKELSGNTLSIIKLMLFYNFSNIILNSFIGVIIYKLTENLQGLLGYTLIMVFFTGFSLVLGGILISYYNISMKYSYYCSILLNTFSYIYLIFNHVSINDFYYFGIIQGLSIGFYWLSLLTYELIHTNDGNRDFYSSLLSLGNQILKIIVPLISIIIFNYSLDLFNNEFELLFYIVPLVYILSLIPLIKIKDFKAQKLDFKELKKKVYTYEGKIITLYTFFDSFKFGNTIVITSYISLLALNSLLNIGFATLLFGFISLLLTLFMSTIRNSKNRMKIMKISFIGIFFAYLPIFFFEINSYLFFYWAILLILFMPLYEVTSKTIHLFSMDRMAIQGSFYTGMIYRSIILWIGRTLSLSVFILLIILVENELLIIKLMSLLLIVSYFIELTLVKRILTLNQ